MNEIENILKRVRDTKALEFGVGAMKKIPAMFDSLFPGKTVVVVAPFVFTDPALHTSRK